MFAKVLFSALFVATLARPDGPPSSFGGYQAPRPQQSYQQPSSFQPQNSYQQPKQQSFQQPKQQSFQQPKQQSFQQQQPSYSSSNQNDQYEKEEGMPFNFAYAVKDEYSGNDFSHASDSDGHVTKGEYRVLLPDGRTQIVTYTANHEDGFLAEVTYEGEARPYEPQQSQNNNQYQQPQKSSFNEPQQSYQQPQQPSFQKPQQTYRQPQQQQPRQQPREQPQPQQSYRQPSQTYNSPF